VIASEFNITSGLNWDDGLSNETSFTYKNLTVNIVNQVKPIVFFLLYQQFLEISAFSFYYTYKFYMSNDPGNYFFPRSHQLMVVRKSS
jgi:hypothetical protein